jgi:two-component system alkaline phosphatase synthesis response regulator PhoP
MSNTNKRIKILVADDEEDITNCIAYTLERELYEVEKAYDGNETLEKYKSFKPDLMILDIMMPIYNGYEICKKLRREPVGIIILTAKTDLVDKIKGLDLGADDYLTKPFEMIELLARVRSLTRRLIEINDVEKDVIRIDGLEINLNGRTVYVDNKLVEFKPKEFDLLAFLFEKNQIVFSREELLNHVWDMDYLGGTRTIDIHIQRIRSKLGRYGELIVTIPKVGYKALSQIE